jgi:hypothetical protein
VEQRPADQLRLERRVEVQHDPAGYVGEREQPGQQVLAHHAGQAAVDELERRGLVAVADP